MKYIVRHIAKQNKIKMLNNELAKLEKIIRVCSEHGIRGVTVGIEEGKVIYPAKYKQLSAWVSPLDWRGKNISPLDTLKYLLARESMFSNSIYLSKNEDRGDGRILKSLE